MSANHSEKYTPGTGSSLYPEHLWDDIAPPATADQFVGRISILLHAIEHAGPLEFDDPEVIASAHRAIDTEIARAESSWLEIAIVKDYMAQNTAAE